MSFWWLFGYVMVAAAGIGVPLALALVMLAGVKPPPGQLLGAVALGVGGGEVAALLCLLAFIAYFKVRVSAEELGGFDAWGRYREITWDHLRVARPVNLLGLKYLRVYGTGGKALLSLPLFLSDLEGFCRLVRRHAGPEHPLALALHEEMTGQKG
jgi:hypothetical protein